MINFQNLVLYTEKEHGMKKKNAIQDGKEKEEYYANLTAFYQVKKRIHLYIIQ